MGATFRVLRKRALDILIVGAPFVLLPQILAGFLPAELSRLSVVAGLPGLVFSGGVSLMTYRELTDGARLSAGEAIHRGLGKFGTLWGAGFLSGLGIALGTLLFVVPGVILLIGWMTTSTSVMVENLTAYAALDRAWTLTKGSRWRIAGLSGLVLLIVLGLFLAFFATVAVLALAAGEATGTMVAAFVLGPILTLLVMAVTTVFPAAVYTGLRRTEGSAGDVAQVFA
jgi:hypothetical protein